MRKGSKHTKESIEKNKNTHLNKLKYCKCCGKKLKEKQIKFCSNRCSSDNWDKENPKKRKEINCIKTKKWNIKNPKYKKEWNKLNKEWNNNYCKNKRKNDIQYKIKCNLRVSLYFALKNYTINGKIKSSLQYGIDWKKVISYLVKNLPKDYYKWNKNNPSNPYTVDHIIPLSSFNLENENEIRRAFILKNLQWLKLKENISKGNKILQIKKKEVVK